MSDPGEIIIEIDVDVPDGATPAEEERLIQVAIDKTIDDKVDKDIDAMLGGFFP